MKAKRIEGEHCRFCGDTDCFLRKTPCCNEWICCEPDIPNYRGQGRCEHNHEKYSLCKQHFDDRHPGSFAVCQKCIVFWGADHKRLIDLKVNYPRFLKPTNNEDESFMARWANSCW